MATKDWCSSNDLDVLFEHLKTMAEENPRVNSRVLRLFGCACCRHIPSVLIGQRPQALLELVERHADGEASEEQLRQAGAALYPITSASEAAILWVADSPWNALEAARAATEAVGADSDAMVTRERSAQVDLLRHIVGDLGSSPPALPSLPEEIPTVAKAVYDQDRAAVAELHRLLDATGMAELAQHFANPRDWHPRGCWAIDLILGKWIEQPMDTVEVSASE